MELLILLNRAQTHADVIAAADAHAVPMGARARVIGPGESHLGIEYDVWLQHKDRTMDLFGAVQSAASRGPAPAPAPEPIRISAVLDGGFQLIRRSAVLMVALAAVWQCGLVLLGAVVAKQGAFGATVTFVTLALAWYGVVQATLITVASRAYHGTRPGLASVLREAARRTPAVVGGLVLAWSLVMLGLLFFIIPGLILMCRYYVVPAVVVLEGRGPWKALGRSGSLSEGNGGTIFMLAVLLEILATFITFGAQGLQSAGGIGASIATAASLVAGSFMFMLKAAVLTAFYYALRVSREAYDLELLADRLPAPEPVPA
jgi:hypothetical protein